MKIPIRRKAIRPVTVAHLVWYDVFLNDAMDRETVLLARDDEQALRKAAGQYPHATSVLVINRTTDAEMALFRAQ